MQGDLDTESAQIPHPIHAKTPSCEPGFRQYSVFAVSLGPMPARPRCFETSKVLQIA